MAKTVVNIAGDSSGAVGAVKTFLGWVDRLESSAKKANAAIQKIVPQQTTTQQAVSGYQQMHNTINAVTDALARLNSAQIKSQFQKGNLSLDTGAVAKTISYLQGLHKTVDGIKNIMPALSASGSGALKSIGAAATTLAPKMSYVVATLKMVYPVMKGIGVGAAALIGAFGSAAASAMSFSSSIRGSVITSLTSLEAKIKTTAKTISTSFMTARLAVANINDGIRLAAQSVTNLGRSMMFFVTIPMAAFLGKATAAAIDFEDALVRVQKTTNLSDAKLKLLRVSLREVAKESSLTHVEIATIAEVLGQMGVTSVPRLAELTKIFEMLTIATDMTSEKVTETLGRIANAFQWNLNESSDEVMRLANVINMLENTTASSASEIMTSLSKWAQTATVLKLNAAEAAALSASLVSMGMSEAEAGTSLRNLGVNLTKHIDVVQRAMGGTEKYSDATKILNAINEDAIGVFLDIASAASKSNNEAAALLTMVQMADTRGGRALAAIASNATLVENNMRAANQEWDKSTSLVTEYNRAMLSTKAQMQVLKNNVNDVAITVGDALLPTINQIIQVAVPAIQMLGAEFAKLTPKAKLIMVAFAGGILILGPILMFLGQITHAISLLLMGFMQILRLVPLFIGGFSRLLLMATGAVKFFLGWPGLVVAGLVGALKVMSAFGVDVAGFFTDLANKAKTWGENLAATFADGFLGGAIRAITAAITYVANLIASFFEGHSPPAAGPLSTIDRWGAGVLEAYLQGFKNADFSILSDVGRMIETALTRGVEDEAMPAALEKVAKARVLLSDLLSGSRGGVVDEGLLAQATEGLGVVEDNVKRLVRVWAKYNDLQERIAAIEARRKDTIKGYQDEIAAIGRSNMSIEEKVEAIRAAQRARDDNLSGLDEEQELLEEQADETKAKLDYEKQMIDALNEQESLFDRIAAAIEKLTSALGGAGDDILGDFSFGEPDDFDRIGEAIDEAGEEIVTLTERLSTGREILQGFIDAWSGADFTLPENVDAQAGYQSMYEIGTKFAGVRDWIFQAYENLRKFSDEIGKLGSGGISGVMPQIVLPEGLTTGIESFVTAIEPSLTRLSTAFENLKGVAETAGDTISTAFANEGTQAALKTLAEWGAKFAGVLLFLVTTGAINLLTGGLNLLSTILPVVANGFAWLMGLIAPFVTWIQNNWPTIVAGFMTLASVLGTILASAIEALGPFFGQFIEWMKLAWETLKGTLLQIWKIIKPLVGPILAFLGGLLVLVFGVIAGVVSGIIGFFGPLINGIITVISGVVNIIVGIVGFIISIIMVVGSAILAIFTGDWGKVVEFLKSAWASIVSIVLGAVELVWGIIVGVFGSILSFIVGFIVGFINFFRNLYNRLVGHSIIPDMMKAIWKAITTKFSEILEAVKTWIGDVIQSIKDKFADFVTAGKDLLQNLWDGAQETWDKILTWFGELPGKMAAAITGAIQTLIDAGKAIGTGFIEGVTSLFRTIAGKAPEPFKTWLENLINGFAIHSPSKVMDKLGSQVGAGFMNGMMRSIDSMPLLLSTTAGFEATSTLAMQSTFRYLPSADGGVRDVAVNINNPVVRDDRDIKRIADQVREELSRELYNRTRFGGHTDL